MIPLDVMVATQSSTWKGFSASRALTTEPNIDFPGTCTHTETTQSPWWKVTLSGTWRISSVKLTNRNHPSDSIAARLQDVDILVDSSVCAEDVDVEGGATLIVKCVGTGSEITVRQTKHICLTLCGFEAYGAEA